MGARPVEGLIVDHKSCGCRSSRLRIKWRAAALGADYLVHKVATSGVDWSALREDFPILQERVNGHPLIYFDSAATSQKPRAVLDVVRNYYEHENANVHRGLHALSARATEHYEKSRQRVADFIGAASADEIVFTRGTTESINLVAQAWAGKFLRAGDVILLTEMEHHSNLVPWQLLAERIGARLRFDSVPPWHGGGEMITSVTLEKSTFKKPPHRFEAGTPNIAGAIGLAAAIDYLEGIGRAEIFKHDVDLASYALQGMADVAGLHVLGPSRDRGGVISFVVGAAHPHDLTTFAD